MPLKAPCHQQEPGTGGLVRGGRLDHFRLCAGHGNLRINEVQDGSCTVCKPLLRQPLGFFRIGNEDFRHMDRLERLAKTKPLGNFGLRNRSNRATTGVQFVLIENIDRPRSLLMTSLMIMSQVMASTGVMTGQNTTP